MLNAIDFYAASLDSIEDTVVSDANTPTGTRLPGKFYDAVWAWIFR